MSWWQPKMEHPSDLLSGILAVPAKRALKNDECFMNAHFVFFPATVF